MKHRLWVVTLALLLSACAGLNRDEKKSLASAICHADDCGKNSQGGTR